MKNKSKNKDPIFAGNYEYVPEGIYQATAIRHEYYPYYDRSKLSLWFQIVDGPHEGKELFMSFNINKKIFPSSKYYKTRLIASKGLKPRRNDRMSPNIFKNKLFTVKVRTVSKGFKGNILSIEDRYSVIDELIEVSAG